MEYLTGNAITDDDELMDNIERIQQTLSFADWTDTENNTLSKISFQQNGL